uniref:CC chemokine SCYA117 n=1 Tax=Epinephelus coioides TaxID=94232 RepID=A0A8E4BP42_EPICO|nr:CC chemokine SCYA117 [Epinephelus coioides]
MHFSISCGLSFMCVTALFFLPAQGTLECADPSPSVAATGSTLIDIHLDCCHNVSMTRIREHVKACYEQKEDKFPDCKLHAYILEGNSDRLYCVDPNASWLQERLEKLKTRGINCTVL